MFVVFVAVIALAGYHAIHCLYEVTRVEIRFFATIRNVTGEKEIAWEEPTATLGELLRVLSSRYGPEFRRWVLDGENLGGSVMIVINGEDARHHGGVETRLTAHDVVSILPIMAGGTAEGSTRRFGDA